VSFITFFNKDINDNIKLIAFIIYIIFSGMIYFVILKNMIKRFHDIGKPSIYIFATLIPIFGIIILFVTIFAESQEGINEYDESINYEDIFPENYNKFNVINESGINYLIVNNIKIFIKKENYKFTIMIKTNYAYIFHNDLRYSSNQIEIKETKEYTHYKNITKNELKKWGNDIIDSPNYT
jgi:heme/copper-type cytochrome/quinol oxidase subunit 2